MNPDAASIATIEAEIEVCKPNCEKFGWVFDDGQHTHWDHHFTQIKNALKQQA